MTPGYWDELQARAWRYAGDLKDGSQILDDTDESYVRTFFYWLPAALSARGMHLERIPGGYVVRRVFRVAK